MQNIRETAANTAASAKAAMDKTKATAQEKVERMSTQDPVRKEMATENKEMRKAGAEANKQYARDQNAASRMAADVGAQPHYTTGGGDPLNHGTQQMPGMGQFQSGGFMDSSGVGQAHPTATGLPRDNTGYGTRTENEDPENVTGRDVPPTRFNYR